MTFLSLNIEKSALDQQKDYLEYQETIFTEEYNDVTQQMATLANSGDTTSSTYTSLEDYQQMYDSQKSSIESQLEAINTEIESYQKAVDTNIKSDCKLSISV